MAYFAKFTERGQRALLTAQREAAQLGRTYVGTCLLYTSRCV